MKISNGLRNFKLNNNSLFHVGYFLLILNQILAQSQYNEMLLSSLLLKILRWFLIGYFLILILRKGKYPYNQKGIIWCVFAIALLTEMLFFNGKLLLLILFVLVISSYKTNIASLLKNHMSALILGLFIVILSSLFGILDTLGVYKQFDNITGFLFKEDNMRFAFGFVNSNVIPITCLYLYLYVILIKGDTYKWYYDIIAVLINYVTFLLCGSRVCIMLVFLAVTLRWFIVINKKCFMSLLVPVTSLILIGCLLFSIVLPGSSLYLTSFVTFIDKLLTARITIMRNVLSRYPITLFGYGGISIDNSVDYLVMDNGYLALFVMRGMIIGLIFIIFLFMMIWDAKKNKNPYFLLFMTIMIIANIVDNSILHYITFPIYVISFNGVISMYIKQGKRK